jgi:hypothetical protein
MRDDLCCVENEYSKNKKKDELFQISEEKRHKSNDYSDSESLQKKGTISTIRCRHMVSIPTLRLVIVSCNQYHFLNVMEIKRNFEEKDCLLTAILTHNLLWKKTAN